MSDIPQAVPVENSNSSCATTIITVAIIVVIGIALFMLLSPTSPVCLLKQDQLIKLDKNVPKATFDEHIQAGKACVLFEAPECPFCQMTLGNREDRSGQKKDVWKGTRDALQSMDITFVQVTSAMRGGAAPWHIEFVKGGFPTIACFQDGTMVKTMAGYNPKWVRRLCSPSLFLKITESNAMIHGILGKFYGCPSTSRYTHCEMNDHRVM